MRQLGRPLLQSSALAKQLAKCFGDAQLCQSRPVASFGLVGLMITSLAVVRPVSELSAGLQVSVLLCRSMCLL